MSPRHLAALGLVLASVLAAPRARAAGAPTALDPGAAAPVRMRHIVDSLWRVADSAIARGDLAALASLFAVDAQVVRAPGDTLRGREAIAAWLAAGAGGAQLSARFNRIEQLVECADWAVEEGSLRVWRRGGGMDDSVVTNIGLRWTRTADAAAQVSFATLEAAAARQARRGARCRADVAVRLSERRRWVVSLAPDGAEYVRAGDARPAFMDRLNDGWDTPDSPQCVLCPRTDHKRGTALPLVSYIGVRYRGPARLGVEAFLLDQSEERYQLYKYEPTFAVRVEYEKKGLIAGALASYEWSWLRVGAGPAWSRSSWEMDERRYSTPMQVDTRSEDVRSFGGVAQAAVGFPIHERFALEGRAQWFVFPEATLEGTTNFGEVPYDPSGVALTFGLGMLF